FGVFGAVGVLFSAAFALIVLPLLVPLPKQGGQPPLWLTRLFEKFHLWQSRRRIWLILSVVVLTAVTALGVRGLSFEGGMVRYSQIRSDALTVTLVVATIVYFSFGSIELVLATLLP